LKQKQENAKMKTATIRKAIENKNVGVESLNVILDVIDSGRGRIEENNEVYVWNLCYDEQRAMLGLAALYQDNCCAKVTHDLRSGQIKNICRLVEDIRLAN
jgi:hypothetical protein